MTDRLDALRAKLTAFVEAREWDQFHNPKNLVMAVAGEAAELMEHFQWLTHEQSANLPAETLAEVELEIADVFLLLLRVCDKLGVDPVDAAERKLVLNEIKYQHRVPHSRQFLAKLSIMECIRLVARKIHLIGAHMEDTGIRCQFVSMLSLGLERGYHQKE